MINVKAAKTLGLIVPPSLLARTDAVIERRQFVKLLGGAFALWPVGARAQQPAQMRRIGVLMNAAADDPYGQARIASFQQVLQQLGWSDGCNVQMDTRWGRNDIERERTYAAESVTLAPHVILAAGTMSAIRA